MHRTRLGHSGSNMPLPISPSSTAPARCPASRRSLGSATCAASVARSSESRCVQARPAASTVAAVCGALVSPNTLLHPVGDKIYCANACLQHSHTTSSQQHGGTTVWSGKYTAAEKPGVSGSQVITIMMSLSLDLHNCAACILGPAVCTSVLVVHGSF